LCDGAGDERDQVTGAGDDNRRGAPLVLAKFAAHVRQMENIETTTRLRIRHALDVLTRTGVLTGAKDTRVTARVQAGLLEAARRRSGIQKETDLVTAGLALLATQDDFGAWLTARRGTLTDDFDIGL